MLKIQLSLPLSIPGKWSVGVIAVIVIVVVLLLTGTPLQLMIGAL
ncbi:hypothetical protein [Nonomuraea sp. NPDC050202]|jgi:hypothetical protein